MAGDSPPVERRSKGLLAPLAAFGRRGEARREAEVAARTAQARAALLSELAHELRTPLACMIGYAKLLSETPQATDHCRMLAQRLTAASEGVLAAVDQVLAASPGAGLAWRLAPPALRPVQAGGRALVADDLEINRDLLRLHLAGRGYAVSEAADGEQALAAAAATPFDLIFLDLNMPGANGLDAARRLRDGGASSAGARLFAVSARIMSPALAEELREAGFDGFIPKPISSQALDAILAEPQAARPADPK